MSRGGLLIWNGCQPDALGDYERWHQHEHLLERVGIPGFKKGSRFEALPGTEPQFFTLYETASPEVLLSPRYRERLADPSPWTRRIMPAFTDVSRTVCRQEASWGIANTAALVSLVAEESAVLARVASEMQGESCLGWSLWQAVVEPGGMSEEQEMRGAADKHIAQALLLRMARPQDATRTATALAELGDVGAYALIASMTAEEARP
ncbi:MAG: hypothetical protein RIC87_08090 [Kiloniellales bacterium]